MSEEESELIMSFWIDTDGYSDRDRLMFVAGVEFQMVYDQILRNKPFSRTIHRENESRVRMMCGKLGIKFTLVPYCDTWTTFNVL